MARLSQTIERKLKFTKTVKGHQRSVRKRNACGTVATTTSRAVRAKAGRFGCIAKARWTPQPGSSSSPVHAAR